MGQSRSILRLLQTARVYHLKTVLKLLAVFLVTTALFMYVQEKHTKETMIDLALGGGSVEKFVLPDNDTVILNGIIGQGLLENKLKNPFMLIVVTSAPENEYRRNVIRTTWGSTAEKYGVTFVFFLGKPTSQKMMSKLKEEAHKFHDLIVDDFEESYYALAIKTLRILKYRKFHHPKTKFLVKTDDDVFVNVLNLVRYCYAKNAELDKQREQQIQEDKGKFYPSYFIGGVIHVGRRPHTWNPFSKWYVPFATWHQVFYEAMKLNADSDRSKEDFKKQDTNPLTSIMLESYYPSYAEGNFYILTDETANALLSASKKVPLFHLEDVYVTGVLGSWILKSEQETMPYISSASNIFPTLSYNLYKMSVPPQEIIAFHCDNHVELISQIYQESVAD